MNIESNQFAIEIRRCADDLARSGPTALGPLYELTAQRLLRYALAVTANRHDAEDVVQTSLVRVASSPTSLATALKPWPYLLRVLRNEAISLARRRRRVNLMPIVPESCDPQSDSLDQFDTQRHVLQALRQIPTLQSEVVVLKIWEGMTFAEIADVLEVSQNTAASRYKYALQKLARFLNCFHDEVVHD